MRQVTRSKLAVGKGQRLGVRPRRLHVGEALGLGELGGLLQHLLGEVAGDDAGDVRCEGRRRVSGAGGDVERLPLRLGLHQLDEAAEACALGVHGRGGVGRGMGPELLLHEILGHCGLQRRVNPFAILLAVAGQGVGGVRGFGSRHPHGRPRGRGIACRGMRFAIWCLTRRVRHPRPEARDDPHRRAARRTGERPQVRPGPARPQLGEVGAGGALPARHLPRDGRPRPDGRDHPRRVGRRRRRQRRLLVGADGGGRRRRCPGHRHERAQLGGRHAGARLRHGERRNSATCAIWRAAGSSPPSR